jgi:hypothetical protein
VLGKGRAKAVCCDPPILSDTESATRVKGGNKSPAGLGKFGILGGLMMPYWLARRLLMRLDSRETLSQWAAESVSRLHPQLAPTSEERATRVAGPDDGGGERQLTLTRT